MFDEIETALTWRPQHLGVSAWIQHTPFARWLISTIRPNLIVELGTHAGVSLFAFCQAASELEFHPAIHAVDTWTGDYHSGHYDSAVFDRVQEITNEHFSSIVTLHRMTFDDAQNYFPDGSVDLLHIDGLHTYEAVAHDFNTWLPKLSGRAVVLFHDIRETRDDFGVWKLWDELETKFPHFAFDHGHGLGVLCVGAEVPEPIERMIDLWPSDLGAIIRTAFASRGEAIELEYRSNLSSERALLAEQEAKLANSALFAMTMRSAEDARSAEFFKSELTAVRNSRSWRLTAPLRRLTEAFRR